MKVLVFLDSAEDCLLFGFTGSCTLRLTLFT